MFFGDVFVVFFDEGIVCFDFFEFDDLSVFWFFEGVLCQLCVILEYDFGVVDEFIEFFDCYFDGELVCFDEYVCFDWCLVDGFVFIVLQMICMIDWGEIMSYGEVVVFVGYFGVVCVVGMVCCLILFLIIVFVYCVVCFDGSIGQYGVYLECK